ncbi:MAG: S1 RNA-binding domain-containing protein [Candidatus Wallbacteria bacterium]
MTENMENFAELFTQSEAKKTKNKIQHGAKMLVKILGFDESSVFVDLGAKTDGYINREELLDVNGNFNYKTGDELEVYVVAVTESEIRLSRALGGDAGVSALKDAFERGIPVSGKVKSLIKGGFEISLMGRRAFCPINHIDVKKVEKGEEYVGNTYNFKIIKFEEKGKNIVLSRSAILEAEQKIALDKVIKGLQKTDSITGKITKVNNIGAFMEIAEGLEGLIHISELSWGRLEHASSFINPGDIVTAKVLKIEPPAEGKRYPRISLSLKQLQKHPWSALESKIKVGEKISGRVTRCTDFGAFVEVMPGVEGLIHISELGADHRLKNASEVLSTGNLIEVMIIGIDPENKKLSLSLKALKQKEETSKAAPKAGDEDDWRNFSKVGDDNGADDDNPFKKLAKKMNDKKTGK